MKTTTKTLAIGSAGAMLAAGLLSGCQIQASSSFTYDVTTGDQIEVTMDLTKGYSLGADGYIAKNGTAIGRIDWLTEADFTSRVQGAYALDSYKHVSYKGNEGVYHEFPGEDGQTQYIYALWIENSNTGIVVMSISGEADASAILNALSFAKVN